MKRLSILIAAILSIPIAVFAQTKPDMVLVDGGSFQMGNAGTATPKGDPDERPVHAVSVKSFYIAKYELTVKEYKQFINDASAAYF